MLAKFVAITQNAGMILQPGGEAPYFSEAEQLALEASSRALSILHKTVQPYIGEESKDPELAGFRTAVHSGEIHANGQAIEIIDLMAIYRNKPSVQSLGELHENFAETFPSKMKSLGVTLQGYVEIESLYSLADKTEYAFWQISEGNVLAVNNAIIIKQKAKYNSDPEEESIATPEEARAALQLDVKAGNLSQAEFEDIMDSLERRETEFVWDVTPVDSSEFTLVYADEIRNLIQKLTSLVPV